MKELHPKEIAYIQNQQKIDNNLPFVIMLHGLQSSKETFKANIQTGFESFNCISIDQRGHGETPRRGEDYSAEMLADDLSNFLDFMGIGGAHFVGHSMGGRTLMAFAARYNKRIKSLVVEDMGTEIRQKFSDEADRQNLEKFKSVCRDSNIYSSIEEIRKILRPLYSYADNLIERKVHKVLEGYKLDFYPDVAVRYGFQGNIKDYTDVLAKSKFPILFLQADPLVGSAMTDYSINNIREKIPSAQIEYFKGAWHSIHKSDADNFNKSIINFLKRISI